MSYMVLEAKSAQGLTDFVNEKIKYGWTPIGGVSVAITTNRQYGEVWGQAVTKAEAKTEGSKPR